MTPHSPPIEPPVIAGQTAVLETLRVGDQDYQIYRVPDLDRLLDEIDAVEFEKDERMPYWAELWPSGVALATFLAEETTLRGVRMLELGCGLGLPSIVAARMGARVTATDYCPEALDLLRVNAALNEVRLETRLLDWRTPCRVVRFGLVVAADVLYEPWQVECVVEVLCRTVMPGGRAVVVDPDRVAAKPFASAATFRGFRVQNRRLEGRKPGMSVVIHDLTHDATPGGVSSQPVG